MHFAVVIRWLSWMSEGACASMWMINCPTVGRHAPLIYGSYNVRTNREGGMIEKYTIRALRMMQSIANRLGWMMAANWMMACLECYDDTRA